MMDIKRTIGNAKPIWILFVPSIKTIVLIYVLMMLLVLRTRVNEFYYSLLVNQLNDLYELLTNDRCANILTTAPEVEQFSYLEIRKKEKSSIREIVSDIFMFEQFLSLATLSIVKSSKITLFDKNTYQQIGGTRLYREIHFIHALRERNNLQSAESKMFRNLFDYSDIKDFYPAIVRKWYNEPIELAPIRDHLINSLEKKHSYGSVDFLIVIQALEGFCRRFRSRKYRKEHGLPERDYSDLYAMMGSLLDEFGDIELILKCNIDKDSVVDSRNYYSHFMPKQKDSKTLDGYDLYELTMRLRILLICCVLSLYGFDNERINEILNKSDSNVLQLL